MINWIKDSKYGILIVACVVGVLLTASACSGNRATDFIQYRNPPQVQQALGVPAKQTLTQAPMTIEQWELYVEQGTRELFANVEQADALFDFLRGLVTGGIEQLEDEISMAFPLGGTIVAGLGVLGGLFLKRPGEEKRVRKEKEDSFNAGQRKARDLVALAKEAKGG